MKQIKLGDYVLTYVGTLSAGLDGNDNYYKVQNFTDAIDINEFRDLAREHFYHDSSRGGGYFCHYVTDYEDSYNRTGGDITELVLVVHGRYDI
jgi:hypothetical protein